MAHRKYKTRIFKQETSNKNLQKMKCNFSKLSGWHGSLKSKTFQKHDAFVMENLVASGEKPFKTIEQHFTRSSDVTKYEHAFWLNTKITLWFDNSWCEHNKGFVPYGGEGDLTEDKLKSCLECLAQVIRNYYRLKTN